ncbi:MAG: cyclic nucleotide-binding domain-containing protein [Parvibaculum sp.]
MADPTKTDIARALERNQWFLRQTPELKRALIEQAQTVRADAGRWLYDAGDDARGLYGVLSGSVRILVQMNEGDYALANIVGRGSIFGYAGRLVGKKRLVTAEVRERSTLIYVPEAGLEAIARKTPDIWVAFRRTRVRPSGRGNAGHDRQCPRGARGAHLDASALAGERREDTHHHSHHTGRVGRAFRPFAQDG